MNHEPQFRLGQIVLDKITGFTGVITSMTEWSNNCPRYTIRPRNLKEDGSMHESRALDVTFLEAVPQGPSDLVRDYPTPRSEAKLGDIVKDANTNLKGTVVAMSYDINGCVGYFVQPRELTADHKIAEIQVIWDLDVRVVKATETPQTPITTGGDRREPVRREPDRRGR